MHGVLLFVPFIASSGLGPYVIDLDLFYILTACTHVVTFEKYMDILRQICIYNSILRDMEG